MATNKHMHAEKKQTLHLGNQIWLNIYAHIHKQKHNIKTYSRD